jgi:hypothetical protein
MSSHASDGRTRGPRTGDADADGREQESDDIHGQAPAEPDGRAVAGRLFVLLSDG